MCWCSCEAKTKTVCPQHSEQKRKERWSVFTWGPPGAVRSQVPGERGKQGEVGEWQCEVRWGARRVVVRRAQGAVGKVSKRGMGNFDGCSRRSPSLSARSPCPSNRPKRHIRCCCVQTGGVLALGVKMISEEQSGRSNRKGKFGRDIRPKKSTYKCWKNKSEQARGR